MDHGSPSPTFQVEQSSPLDSLVRRASSRRAKVAKLADALTVPYVPPHYEANTLEHDIEPPSPLLHTQFRGSVASTSPSNYDRGSLAADSHASGSWDSRHQRLDDTRRPYQPHTTREVSVASAYSTASVYSEPMPPDPITRLTEVPTVVVSTEAEAMPTVSRTSTSGRMPIQLPPGITSYPRPIPPPVDAEERKRQVLMRNTHSHGGTPAMSVQSPKSSIKHRPTLQQSHSEPLHRSNSQLSIYSSYSYYPYDGQIPSPSGSAQHLSPIMPSPTIAVHPPSPTHDEPPSPSTPGRGPQTAQDYLQLGIQHHLGNKLSESAICFEKSATIGGGCGMGMLMWGLTLRHGWGCVKSESKGFKWLRRAAEMAVGDLESTRAGVDSGAVKSELVLAIYEVGQSFFRGWGVEKDKIMAVKYFRLASELGDPDAQQDLAFCLANGKGCKKDRKEAAKWYRAAVAQGVSNVGLAWIYKEKFQ